MVVMTSDGDQTSYRILYRLKLMKLNIGNAGQNEVAVVQLTKACTKACVALGINGSGIFILAIHLVHFRLKT